MNNSTDSLKESNSTMKRYNTKKKREQNSMGAKATVAQRLSSHYTCALPFSKYGDTMHAEVVAQGQQHYVDNQEPGIGHEIR